MKPKTKKENFNEEQKFRQSFRAHCSDVAEPVRLHRFRRQHSGANPGGRHQPPAQPVPMVGLVKDSDAPARKPFQWFNSIPVSLNGAALTLTTVPLNQRLVIEDVSGYCKGSVTLVYLVSHSIANVVKGKHYFPATFWNGTGPASSPVRFYVDPGQDFNLLIGVQGGTGNCDLAVSGYFVDLP